MMLDLTATHRRNQLLLALAACLLAGAAWQLIHHPLIGLLACLVPLGAVIVLRLPFPMVLLFVLFSFFRLHEVVPALNPLHLPQLLALAALASLGWGLVHRQIDIYWSAELTAFAVFFALVTCGVLLASNVPMAVAAWTGIYVKIGIMVLAIAWLLTKRSQFRLSVYAVMTCGVVVGGVALYNKLHGIGLVEGTRVTIGRDIGSMLGDPNDLALTLLFPASFAVAMLTTRGVSRLGRLAGLICFGVVFAAIIATQSRGGLLGILAVCGTFAWRHVRSKVLLMTAGSVALVLLLALANISDRASGGAVETGIDESAMGRIYAWGAAFRMAVDNPVSGVGLNNFVANYWAYSAHWDGQNHAVHSTWFGVLGETGFAGLTAFLVMVVLTILGAWRTVDGLRPKRDRAYEPAAYVMAQGVQAGLLGFVVSGTFLTMGFVWPFYILLALAVALRRFEREQRLASQNVSQSAQTAPRAAAV